MTATGWPELLVLVRHGKSLIQLYKEGLFFSDEKKRAPLSGMADRDIPLCDEGWLQAKKTGEKIRTEYGTFDCAYQSTCLRNRKTLEVILSTYPEDQRRKIPVLTTELLDERDWGMLPLLLDHEVGLLYPEFETGYAILGEVLIAPRGKENLLDVRKRCAKWLQKLRTNWSNKKVLAIDHWGSRISILAELENWGERQMLDCMGSNNPANCSVAEYRFDRSLGQMKLIRYNEILYL